MRMRRRPRGGRRRRQKPRASARTRQHSVGLRGGDGRQHEPREAARVENGWRREGGEGGRWWPPPTSFCSATAGATGAVAVDGLRWNRVTCEAQELARESGSYRFPLSGRAGVWSRADDEFF
jgi:hypothetical protein